jgi:hypothetical protein
VLLALAVEEVAEVKAILEPGEAVEVAAEEEIRLIQAV